MSFCKSNVPPNTPIIILVSKTLYEPGADPGFQVRGGAHLKKMRRAEGGAKFFGVFRVKNHDFTPKNHIFSNCEGGRENCWGITCEKSRFYAKNIFSNFKGGGWAPGAPPSGSAPDNVVPSEGFKQRSLQHISAYIRHHRVSNLLIRSQVKSN